MACEECEFYKARSDEYKRLLETAIELIEAWKKMYKDLQVNK